MSWRRQLPAWSPISVRALALGAVARAGSTRNAAALSAVVREAHGASLVQLTDSGTTALALALIAASPHGAKPRVALPAWGCYDLMTAADIADAEVVLYDLDPHTLAPAVASFTAALECRPSTAVVAHWFGVPVALEPFHAAARAAGAALVEDAAQGVGGSVGGRPLGSFGDFGILSFGRGKGRVGGRGGAVLANTASAAAQLRAAGTNVGPAESAKGGLLALAAQWAFGRPWAYGVPSAIPQLRLGETIYHPAHPIAGIPEWAAAVARAHWERAMTESAARRGIALRWGEVTARVSCITGCSEWSGSRAGWLRYPVLVRDATALRDHAARRLGVMCGYERILADLPVAAGRIANAGPFPGAEELAGRLRTLPSHSQLRAGDMDAIVKLLENACRQS